MGFHLAGRVYSEIKGTTPTEQAVLAYLAFRAADETGKCFPSRDAIEAATHFKATGISNALNGLREKKILTWIKGGRLPKRGGKALANEYLFNFPKLSTKLSTEGVIGCSTSDVIHRDATNAYAATKPMHMPPGDQCICRDAATIINNHNKHHPSVIKRPPPSVDEPMKYFLRNEAVEIGRQWSLKRQNLKQQAPKIEEKRSLPQHALKACGLTVDDKDNYWAFCTAMKGKDYGLCEDEILAFESELKHGEHKNARNLAAVLMSRLQRIPEGTSGDLTLKKPIKSGEKEGVSPLA